MTLAFAEVLRNQSEADASSYTTASVSFVRGRLYLISIEMTKAAGIIPLSVATTAGVISWDIVSSGQVYSTAHSLSVWRAIPDVSVSDTVVITRNTSTSCAWSIVEVTGMTQAGINGSGATPTFAKVSAGLSSALTTTLTRNLRLGNGRYTTGGAAITAGGLVVSSGTWTSGSLNSHANPPVCHRVAWQVGPAVGDKSSIWTPGSAAGMAGIIIEIGAGDDTFAGDAPL